MYILAIETTGAFASVALLQAEEDPKILGVIHGNDRFSHLQNLTPQIDQVLKDHGLSIGDVTAIAVSHGPGSFTGIRIGVATARALAQCLNIPCLPVSSLEALALRACETDADPRGGRLLICPALDARRKQVYGAAYEISPEGRPICRIQPSSCLMKDFLKEIDAISEGGDGPDQILFLGDGIDTCGDILREWEGERAELPAVTYASEECRYQSAETVALRGWQLFEEGKGCGYMQLEPEYLRMAEAEKKLKDRQAAETGRSRA